MSAAVTPGRKPAKMGPGSSTHHISVFASPPTVFAVMSLGWTWTLRRFSAQIFLTSSGKDGQTSQSVFPPPPTILPGDV